NSGSILAAHEAALRHKIGINTLMWGADYPHLEGVWPRTRLSMRKTFSDVPEDDTRIILGLNALDVYNLDEKVLGPLAQQIGPIPAELSVPVAEHEYPAFRGRAFLDA